MSAAKRSISAPEDLFAQADARKEQLGYFTFSDYIQALLRADAVQGGAHLRETVDPTPPAAVNPVPITYLKPRRPRK